MKSYRVNGPFPLHELNRIARLVAKTWPKAVFRFRPEQGTVKSIVDQDKGGVPLALIFYKDERTIGEEVIEAVGVHEWIVTIEVWEDCFVVMSADAGAGATLAKKIKALFW